MATTNLSGKLRVGALESIEPLSIKGQSAFDEVVTAEFSPLIELDSSNGLSPVYRDSITTTNSGSVTNVEGEHKISTGSTASSTANLSTHERGRYQPGIVGLPGLLIRRPTAPTGNQEIRWGYFDDQDGFFFGEDKNGIFVRLRNGGVDRDKVYQEDWNVDTLTGKGGSSNPSRLKFNLKQSRIYRMPFVWYGSGPAEMTIVLTDPDNANQAEKVVVHRFAANEGENLIQNPKLPLNAEADNGGDSENIELFVGGRQFAVLGRYDPNRRQTSEKVVQKSFDTGDTPLISFKKKSDRESKTKSVKINSFGIVSDNTAIVSFVLGASLSGASYGSVTDIGTSETALESDTSATSLSGGTVLDRTLIDGGKQNESNFAGSQSLGIDIPNDTSVTLAVEGLATGTATATFTLEEEW